jgi:CRISPR/Cas system-associated protein Csm6
MAKKPTLLEEMRSANIETYLDHMAGRSPRSLDDVQNPSRKHIASRADEELAELIVGEPASRAAELARSVLRQREAWRTPAKWSVIIAVVSLITAIGSLGLASAAFLRTL